MNMWEKMSDDILHRWLSLIGETRLVGQALSRIFGCFGNPDNALFVDLTITLKRIVEDILMKVRQSKS